MYKYLFIVLIIFIIVDSKIPTINPYQYVEPMVKSNIIGEDFESNISCKLISTNQEFLLEVTYVNSTKIKILLFEFHIHDCRHYITCSNIIDEWSFGFPIYIIPHLLNITHKIITSKDNLIMLEGIGFSNCDFARCKMFYSNYSETTTLYAYSSTIGACDNPRFNIIGCINVIISNNWLRFSSSHLCYQNQP